MYPVFNDSISRSPLNEASDLTTKLEELSKKINDSSTSIPELKSELQALNNKFKELKSNIPSALIAESFEVILSNLQKKIDGKSSNRLHGVGATEFVWLRATPSMR
ncbi:MAG: hypothetical protein H7A37_09815 [Chlamydiales bacterium]|nr:hypothetical protein [Chlamydiales bacterium]